MKTSTKLIASILGAVAIVATPALSFADTTTTPAPTATHAPKAAKTPNPAVVAYRAAVAQRHQAIATRHTGRTAADTAFKNALAAAKTPAEKQAARAAHKAAIAALPAVPAKPIKPTK
jgi:hypothetical protein